jgi:hypothetical protein
VIALSSMYLYACRFILMSLWGSRPLLIRFTNLKDVSYRLHPPILHCSINMRFPQKNTKQKTLRRRNEFISELPSSPKGVWASEEGSPPSLLQGYLYNTPTHIWCQVDKRKSHFWDNLGVRGHLYIYTITPIYYSTNGFKMVNGLYIARANLLKQIVFPRTSYILWCQVFSIVVIHLGK